MVAVIRGDAGPEPSSPFRMGGGPLAAPKGSRPPIQPKSSVITFSKQAMPTPKQVRQWVQEQTVYPNMARDPEIANRVLAHIRNHVEKFEHNTVTTRTKWANLNFVLRGVSLGDDIVDGTHVPELYKMLEAIVPRIEEAILSYDPWFNVRGREEMDRDTAEKIQAILESQLREARLPLQLQGAIRAMLVYGFSAFKVYWHIDVEKRIKRDIEKLEGKKVDEDRYRVTRKEEEQVTWFGPKIKLIDPLNFFVDLTSTMPPEDCLFIGDETRMTPAALESGEDQGIYVNTRQLKEEKLQARTASLREWDKQHRQLEPFRLLDEEQATGHGLQGTVPVVEIWEDFDLHGDGKPVPCVLTVANYSTCIRAQENPNDDKHVPYAVARCSREHVEFLNVAPLDHGIGIQNNIDENRALAQKSHRLAISPIMTGQLSDDLPATIFDILPGSFIQTEGKIDTHQFGSTLNEYAGFFGIERRDLEEITGAPRIYEGTEGSNTATEVERKIQEGNRRIRSYIMSLSFQLEHVLRIMHALNGQWMTAPMQRRVLGKQANGMSIYTEVGPQDLCREVDFEFAGLSGIQSLGLRATMLQQWASTIYPFLALAPQGTVNVEKVIARSEQMMLGNGPGDSFVESNSSIDDMIPQSFENDLLIQGQKVEVHPEDDDVQHMEDMRDLVEAADQFETSTAEIILSHFLMHAQAAEKKEVQEKARAAQQPVQQIDNGRGTTGERQDTGEFTTQTVPGETPGPENGARIGAPDRNYSPFSGENRAMSNQGVG